MQYPVFPSSTAVIALLTDFGLKDHFVGVMKGVIAGLAPGTTVIDITHEIPAHDILAGSLMLATSYRYFPHGTVFECVVDPGVGSDRAAIALHAGDWYFVGPDNGIFQSILEQQTVHGVVKLTNSNYHLPMVRATFHGRDIFAPVSAYLATGTALNELGTAMDVADLCRLDIAQPVQKDDRIEAQIVSIDYYGNLITNIPLEMMPDFFSRPNIQLAIPDQGVMITERRHFFAERPGDQAAFLLVDSSGTIAIAINNGSAASRLHVQRGEKVVLFSGPVDCS